MLQDLTNSQLKTLWRQGRVPVIFKRSNPLRVLLVRLPFAEGNLEWLRDDRRSKPKWATQFKAWEIPTAWFDSVIQMALRRYGLPPISQTPPLSFRRQQFKVRWADVADR